ncbi:hypothetical protein SNEBB_011154 [Seison nebaliae]|nr:hypothetical protein SNEBB_011154 [Seison nebaliae]
MNSNKRKIHACASLDSVPRTSYVDYLSYEFLRNKVDHSWINSALLPEDVSIPLDEFAPSNIPIPTAQTTGLSSNFNESLVVPLRNIEGRITDRLVNDRASRQDDTLAKAKNRWQCDSLKQIINRNIVKNNYSCDEAIRILLDKESNGKMNSLK